MQDLRYRPGPTEPECSHQWDTQMICAHIKVWPSICREREIEPREVKELSSSHSKLVAQPAQHPGFPFPWLQSAYVPQPGHSQSLAHRKHFMSSISEGSAGHLQTKSLPQGPCTCCSSVFERLSTSPGPIFSGHTGLCSQVSSSKRLFLISLCRTAPLILFCHSSQLWTLPGIEFCINSFILFSFCLPWPEYESQSVRNFVLLIAVSPVPEHYLTFKRCLLNICSTSEWI